jgi:lipopolysaccharide transport system permease protein
VARESAAERASPRDVAVERRALRADATTYARNRALFVNFYRRELLTRYLGSTSALLWAFVQPLLMLAVYHFVFTSVFRVGAFDGRSFLPFVAVALWPWLAAQEGLVRASVAVPAYGALIRKVAFPHELVVYASVAATFTLQLAGYLVVLVALSAFGEPVHFAGLALALPIWAIMTLGVAGIALALSALQVFVRDVEHVLTPVLTIVMYLTPILYPLSLVPEGVRAWVAANPFGWLVGRLRDALLEGRIAPRPADAVALAVALALFFAGRWVFRRLSPHFEDFV